MLGKEFENYFKGILEMVHNSVGDNNYAQNLCKKNYFIIKTGFYENKNPESISNEIVFPVKKYINEIKMINETKGIDEPVRKIVRHIINIVKSKEYGEYSLPEDVPGSNDLEYDFDSEAQKFGLSRSYNIPPFSIELNYGTNINMNEPYMCNAALLNDGETIGMVIIINPEYYPQLMYDLVADVNDLIAHELEHLFQEHGMRPEEEVNYGEEKPEGAEYYMQKHEVPAQIKGLRRIAKIRNQPIEQVIREWFKRNKYAHQMKDDEVERVINYLLSKYEERYGTV